MSITNKKKAFITGITGQDGSYLAEFLLEKGYEVHGLIRRSSTFNTERIDHLFQDPHNPVKSLFLHYGDLSDAGNIRKLIFEIEPDEIYNLGAQSHVRVSFDMPEFTGEITGLGALRILEGVKDFQKTTNKSVKFYQASSSEMFGSANPPQNENTVFCPRSPYGSAKIFAYYTTINYREAYNIFAVNGILFNHESPRRGETFVTKKICHGLVKIKLGKLEKIYLGNLDAKRDWGYAPDFVEGMYLMMQQEKPDDYVLATGEAHSVREFVEEAANILGINFTWEGNGLKEVGINKETGQVIIEIDPVYYRPTEIDILLGDSSKAREKLGWKPRISFRDMISIMIEYDLKKYETTK